MTTDSITEILDLREVESSQQHHLFLRAFLALTPGEAFLLQTSRDPDGLLYPIRLIYAGEMEVRVKPPVQGIWSTIVRRRALTGRLGRVSI
ncbi:MAG: DUF2249 domain-containing protein [Candidatus Sericytochromatia bacterium]